MQKLLVVSSAFNEEDNLEQFVEEIKYNYERFRNNCEFNLIVAKLMILLSK